MKLISGHCNHHVITKLQRFILRRGCESKNVIFTPASKHCATLSYGNHFTFLINSISDRDVEELKNIVDYLEIRNF